MFGGISIPVQISYPNGLFFVLPPYARSFLVLTLTAMVLKTGWIPLFNKRYGIHIFHI